MRVQTTQPDTEGKLDQRSLAEADSASALSLGDIAQMLGRHKWFILVCIVIGTVVAVVYVKSVTPIYEATASIRIDPGRIGSLGLADLTGTQADSAEMIATEMAIIKSDAVAIDTMHSLSDEEFRQYAGPNAKQLAIPIGATSLSPAQEEMLSHFKSQINVLQVPSTQLVTISFRNPNPQVAALLANRLIEAYLRQTFDSRYGSVTQVTKWLSSEMDSLRERASEAQKKLADFQEKNNILMLGGGSSGSSKDGGGESPTPSASTVTDRLSQLNNRLTLAQGDRIVKEAQMRAAENGNTAVLAAMFPSSNLTALQSQQGVLYSQYVQLSTKFGQNYPPLAEVKTQMQKTDAELERQSSIVKNRLKQEYDTAVAIQNSLQQQYDEQTDKAYALNRKAAEFAVLYAEGSSSRELYNTLQYKLQQAGVDAGLQSVNTMRVDTARAPLIPVEPKKLVILSFGLVLGLFAGVGSAFLREALSDKLQSVDQIERALGYQLLAIIPHISIAQKTEDKGDASAFDASQMLVAYNSPLSVNAEAFRNLRNALLLSSIDRPAKMLLVSSTIPGEGKSSTTANYGIVLAQKGARVLLVDADLRRPALHSKFGVENKRGLSNLILGDDTAEPFTNPLPDLDNLFLLTAGKKVALPSEALGSNKFYSLLQQWEQEFDYIIVDSAPLLIVSDSLPLASWADALILVTRYNMTPLGALKRIRDVLRHTNAQVAGVVINDMAVTQTGYYGGYGSGYYN
jgi:succinoglycan biosynthesis transport protein ExoP